MIKQDDVAHLKEANLSKIVGLYDAKNIINTLLIITCVFFSCSMHSMELDTFNTNTNTENKIQKIPWLLHLPKEIVIHIAGYCQQREKAQLMEVSQSFYAGLQDKESVLLANPATVTLSLKIKKVFEYARSGDAKKLSIWLSFLKAKEVNQANTDRWTPLYIASRYGHTEVVRLLLTKDGIKVNKADDIRQTPLYMASEHGHTDIVRLLIDSSALVNQANMATDTPLHTAVRFGCTDIVRLLIGYSADVNKADAFGHTPLITASRNGKTEIIQLLINAHADVDKTTNGKQTPLLFASSNGCVDIVRLLLKTDADVNKADRDGVTALHSASREGNTEIVQLLLQSGANVNQSITGGDRYFKKGDTALQVAQQNGHTQIVALIEEYLRRKEKL